MFSVANVRLGVIKCCYPSVCCEVFVGMVRRTSVSSSPMFSLFNGTLLFSVGPLPSLPLPTPLPAPVHSVKVVVTRDGHLGQAGQLSG